MHDFIHKSHFIYNNNEQEKKVNGLTCAHTINEILASNVRRTARQKFDFYLSKKVFEMRIQLLKHLLCQVTFINNNDFNEEC